MRECSAPQTCFGQSGEVYRWRVCYQRGLPRLVDSIIGSKVTLITSLGLAKRWIFQRGGVSLGMVANELPRLVFIAIPSQPGSFLLKLGAPTASFASFIDSIM